MVRMLKALDSSASHVRKSSLEMLGILPPATLAPHVPAVMRMIRDPSFVVRFMAERTLLGVDVSELAKHTSVLVEALEQDLLDARRKALVVLREMPPCVLNPHVPALLRMISDRDNSVSQLALGLLRSLQGSALAEHATAILQLLDLACANVRDRAIALLDMLPPPALAALAPKVLELVIANQLEKANAWRWANRMLLTVDAAVLTQHISLLLRLLDHSTAHVRQIALEVMIRLSPLALAPHAVVVMRMALYDTAMAVRDAAARTLSSVDASVLTAHASVFPEALGHKKTSTRVRALDVLAKLPSAALTPHAEAVALMLGDQEDSVCTHALRAMARLAPAALASLTAAVLRMMSHPCPNVRQSAADTASQLDEAVLTQHTAVIEELLDHSDARARACAVRWLCRVPPAILASHAQAVVSMAILDLNSQVLTSASITLSKLDAGTSTQHTSMLLVALGHSVAKVRKQALDVFTRLPSTSLTPLAATVVMQMSVHDPNPSVRSCAVHILCERTRALSKTDVSLLTEDHVVMLRGMLEHDEADARKLALNVMGRLLPAALAPHMAAVLCLLDDQCVNQSAMRAMKKPGYVPLLLQASSDTDAELSRRAKQVLRLLSPTVLARHASIAGCEGKEDGRIAATEHLGRGGVNVAEGR
jgi:hypothetical protein